MDRTSRVEELFLTAAELDAAARAAFLDRECAADPDLRREVESLLDHHATDDFLDSKGAPGRSLMTHLGATVAAAEETLPPNRKFGAYTIQGVLGQGGMGVVYVAEQERPRRTVALKVIRRGLASPGMIRRFEHEAEVLGRLQHPGIAQIFEAGVGDFGHGPQPFIAMELVDGPPLLAYADYRRLGARDRLALLAKVCDAVQHAHQRGVIHRDLKPANILVNAQGQPKVLDFGVARAAGSDLHLTTVQTGMGQLIGTLPYMSPEQVAGDADEIDTRADVYALGVTLYQLLAGRLPFDLKSRSIPEAARIIRDERPARLSSIDRVFRGDVETIVSKAIEKDKARRYQSAADLGADIHRYLAGQPIAAKNDSALYVFRKQLRRYRGAVAAACLFVIGLSAFSVYASAQSRRNARLYREAEALRLQESVARAAAESARAAEHLARDEADAKAEALRRSLYVSAIGHAHAALLSHDIEKANLILDRCDPDLRGWEWRYLRRTANDPCRAFEIVGANFGGVVVAPGATRFAGWSRAGQVTVYDAADGSPLLGFSGAGTPLGAAFGRRDSLLAVSWPDGSITLTDLESGRTRPLRPGAPDPAPGPSPTDGGPQAGAAAAFTPDATGLYTLGGSPARVTLLDVETGRPRLTHPAPGAYCLAPHPRGDAYAVGYTSGAIEFRDAATGTRTRLLRPHAGTVRRIDFSPDGERLASASNDTTVYIEDLATQAGHWLRGHANKVWWVDWSPDGRRVASAGTEVVVRITEAATGAPVRILRGHESTVFDGRFTADGLSLVTGGKEGTMRRWEGIARPRQETLALGAPVAAGALAGDGPLFLGLQSGHVVEADPLALRERARWNHHKDGVVSLAISADPRLLVSAGRDARVVVRDLAAGAVVSAFEPFGPGAPLSALALAPDGAWVAVGGAGGLVLVCDTAGGSPLRTYRGHEGAGPVTALAVSPDGTLAASGRGNADIQLWDPRTLEPRGTLPGHRDGLYSLTFSPDGSRLVSGGHDDVAQVWDVAQRRRLHVLRGHHGPVYAGRFSAGGTRLVTGGWDTTVRLWDAASGEELLSLGGHLNSVFTVLWAAGGERLLTSGEDGSLLAWDTRDLAPPDEDAARSGGGLP